MRNSSRMANEERAVSEIIGYILIFALIITTVGFVSISGLPTFDSVRESEQLQNAERAFDVLNSNMAEVHERGAPSRATELNAGDATVETGEPVTFNVSVKENGDTVEYAEAEINPVVFSGLGETEFVYVAGAVIRDQPDRSLMLREPPFKLGEKRAAFTLVETFSDSRQSTGGGTVLVRAASTSRSVAIADTSTADSQYDEINITVSDSPRQDLWERYFEDELGMENCDNGAELSCQGDLDGEVKQTFVTVQEIEINLEI